MADKVFIFDTTLRDGEQVPGAKLAKEQKVEIAKQLAALQVDIIEAGFPASSPGDFEAVREVARVVKGPVITGLARAVRKDIDTLWEAVKGAKRPRIHTFLGTSDIHIQKKFRSDREKILRWCVDTVKYARSLCPDVEFSTEDASRTDFEFLCRSVEAIVKAGATTINVPDTVGYATPQEMADRIRRLKEKVPALDKAVLSMHCHNDLGLATANTLAGILAGARQAEVTVNGIGERAGNAAMEEVVMAIRTRKEVFGKLFTDVNVREIAKTSKMVSALMGLPVQRNKAIVGTNAFAHSSGIHQDGILKDRSTYEIIRPEDVGVSAHTFTLTARSGRAALKHHIASFGTSTDARWTPFTEIHRAGGQEEGSEGRGPGDPRAGGAVQGPGDLPAGAHPDPFGHEGDADGRPPGAVRHRGNRGSGHGKRADRRGLQVHRADRGSRIHADRLRPERDHFRRGRHRGGDGPDPDERDDLRGRGQLDGHHRGGGQGVPFRHQPLGGRRGTGKCRAQRGAPAQGCGAGRGGLGTVPEKDLAAP
jgi:isopropylmalate/homocitrate/citramalate synthase